MKLNFEQETPNGVFSFNGEINDDEVEFLVKYALFQMALQGTLPFKMVNAEDVAIADPTGSNSLQ